MKNRIIAMLVTLGVLGAMVSASAAPMVPIKSARLDKAVHSLRGKIGQKATKKVKASSKVKKGKVAAKVTKAKAASKMKHRAKAAMKATAKRVAK
jgi:hypothetical protein